MTLPDINEYKSLLGPVETEKAIGKIKDFFQINLAVELNLIRVTAPMFVKSGSGINDDLTGVEKPLVFQMQDANTQVEIVQSLAKWKRLTLADLEIESGKGIYADLNALRPMDKIDEIHSLYVDQWDWEQAIEDGDRNLEYLKKSVRAIYGVIRRTELYVRHEYPQIKPLLPEEIKFIHTEDLEDMYPNKAPSERENAVAEKYGAVFIIGIGGALKSGYPHDGRAADYDDWSTPTGGGYRGLNGDILVFNPVLRRAFELSSMGIRVTPESLERQLEMRGLLERKRLYYHQRLLRGELPACIGGGIGQSRLCMLYLRKAHIGEIQASVWPDVMIESCKKRGVSLL